MLGSRLQQIGFLLLVTHICLSLLGFYQWLSEPTYDVYVRMGDKAFLVTEVEIPEEYVDVRKDTTVRLYRGGTVLTFTGSPHIEVTTINQSKISRLWKIK